MSANKSLDNADNTADNHTGELIKTLRKLAGMTQMQLAEKIGISYQQIQKYEYGVSQITLNRLKALAGALEVPADVFLHDHSAAGKQDAMIARLSKAEVALIKAYRKYSHWPLHRMLKQIM